MSPNPKKILVLAANPKNSSKLRLDEEIREIDEGMRRSSQRSQFQLIYKLAVRVRDFYRHILDTQPQIIHFSGHGTEKDGIFLENETGHIAAVNANALSDLFELFATKGIECVLFNACYSEEQAEAISKHIPYVIGMSKDIGDRAAISFAIAFYDAIGAGETVEFAFELGRNAIQLEGIPDYQIPILKKGPPLKISASEQDNLSGVIPPCPYKGLFAFQEEDAELFFGRDTVLDDHLQVDGQSRRGLVHLVQHNPLVAVVGASGSGKSSVVFAGLLPRLRSLGQWEICKFRPGSPDKRPFNNLAAELLKLLPPLDPNADSLILTNQRAQALQQGEITFQDVLAEVKRQFPQIRQLLIVIDQFEELYVQCSNTDRQSFLDFLFQEIITVSGLKVVITLRADFCGYAYNDRRLSDCLQNAQMLIGPMNTEELKSAIIEPAKQFDVVFQSGLVERILEDVGPDLGNLPLVEFTLTRLWEQQTAPILTHEAYTRIGGVKKALAKHAEDVFKQLNKNKQKIVKSIFIQLVVPSSNPLDVRQDVRRTVTHSDLKAEEWEIVKFLAGQESRLLVANLDPATKQGTLEIIHEALLREWPSLRQWIDENRQFRIWQEEIKKDIARWRSNKTSKEFLLQGISLIEAEKNLDKYKDLITHDEKQFIHLSKRAILIRRGLWGIVTASITAAFLGLGIMTWQERIEKEYNEVLAISSGESSRPELLQAARKVLKRADTLRQSRNESSIATALHYYRAVIQYSETIQAQNDKRNKSLIEELLQDAEQGLLTVILENRIPQLEEQLSNQPSKIGHRQNRNRILFENQYTEGALKTTYAILRREFGAKADIYNSGQISSPQEADRMPCSILAEIERLWREYTDDQCGWYSKKNNTIYRDPSCELLNQETLTAKVFDYPFEASINRLKECQVVPADVISDPTSNLFE